MDVPWCLYSKAGEAKRVTKKRGSTLGVRLSLEFFIKVFTKYKAETEL